MASFILFASLLFPTALAIPHLDKRAAPQVQLANIKVVGSSSFGIDSFKGIPFAQPPVGNLRLKPPQPITTSQGTLYATATPRACPQGSAPINAASTVSNANTSAVISQIPSTDVSNVAEDCLTLNVQRPSTATNSSKLPVLFWIYGGGWVAGSTASYDGSSIVSTSVSQKKDIVYVSVNYRLGAFGWLSSKQLAAEGSTNLGLRDQRLALQVCLFSSE